MGLEPTVYGFADHDAVDAAIDARVNAVRPIRAGNVAELLGEAVAALSEINQTIPTQSKHRHLIAPALERFANGT